jgi:hypothetical protein
MASRAGCRALLPVHHSTFKLSDEPVEEPLARLLAAAGACTGTPAVPLVLPLQPGEIRLVLPEENGAAKPPGSDRA